MRKGIEKYNAVVNKIKSMVQCRITYSNFGTEKNYLSISLPHRCYDLISIIFLFPPLQGRSPQGKSGFRSMKEKT